MTAEQDCELQELVETLEELRRLRESNGLAFYEPHAKQAKFHAANYKRRYVRTGNRFGKSTCGAAEDVAWCLGERTWLPENDPNRTVGIPKHSVKGVIIVADWAKAEEIFTSQLKGRARGKLFQLIPENAFVGVSKTSGGEICRIDIKSIHGGISSIYIDTVKSFLANPMGNESSDWDFVHVDEPMPQAMWEAYARGLTDRGGYAWFMCTPLNEMWINDMFIPGDRTHADFDEGESFNDTYWVMTGSTRDNPNLEASNIDAMIRDMRKSEIAARIDGRPKLFSGIIHKNYDRDIHLYKKCPFGWEDVFTPPANWTRRWAIDPHLKIPHAVLAAATAPTGHVYIYTEIFFRGLIAELCEEMTSRLALTHPTRKFVHPSVLICDPLAWNPNPQNGIRIVDEFARHGFTARAGSKNLSFAIIKTEDLFEARDEYGLPMVQIHESCLTLQKELDRYVWDDKKEKPKNNQEDHMIENLHRLVMAGLQYLDETPIIVTPKERVLGQIDAHLFNRRPRQRVTRIPDRGVPAPAGTYLT